MKGFGIIQNDLGRNACGKNCNTGVCLGGELNKLFSLQESKKPVRVIVRFPHCHAQLIISLPLCCTFKTSNPKTFTVSLSILVRKLAASIAAQLCHQKEFAEKLLSLLGSFSSDNLKSYHSKQNSHFEKSSRTMMANSTQQLGTPASACSHAQHDEMRKSEKTSQTFYFQLQSAKESQQFGGIDNFINEIAHSLVFISIRLLGLDAAVPIEINEQTMENEITLCDLQNIEVQLGQISPFLVEQIQLSLEEQDRKDLDQMKHHRKPEKLNSQNKQSALSPQNDFDHSKPLNLKKTQRYQLNESKDLWNYSSDLRKPNKDTRINNNNSSHSLLNQKHFQRDDESDKEFNSTGLTSVLDNRSLNLKEKSHQNHNNSCKDSPWLSPIITKGLKRQFSEDVFKFDTPVQKKIKSNNNNNPWENYQQQKQLGRQELENAQIELSYERFVQEMSNSTACSSASQVSEKQKKTHANKDFSQSSSAQSTSMTLLSSEQFPASDFLESDQELLRNSLQSIQNQTPQLQDPPNHHISSFKKPKSNSNNSQQCQKNENSLKLGQVAFKEDEILSGNHAGSTSLLSQQQSSYMLPSKSQYFSQRVKQFKEELLFLGEIIMNVSIRNSQNFLNQTDLSKVIKQMIHKFSLFPLDIQQLITDLVRICPAWLSTTNTKYGTVLTCNNSSFKLENLQRIMQKI